LENNLKIKLLKFKYRTVHSSERDLLTGICRYCYQ